MFVGQPLGYPGSDNKKFYYLKCYHVYSYYSLKLSLLGWLVILFTTWLTKIFVDPDLKSYFFQLPKCLSIDFATNHLDLFTLGPFQQSISLVSNFLKLQFLWGLVCNSATLPIDSITDSLLFSFIEKLVLANSINNFHWWEVDNSVTELGWFSIICFFIMRQHLSKIKSSVTNQTDSTFLNSLLFYNYHYPIYFISHEYVLRKYLHCFVMLDKFSGNCSLLLKYFKSRTYIIGILINFLIFTFIFLTSQEFVW